MSFVQETVASSTETVTSVDSDAEIRGILQSTLTSEQYKCVKGMNLVNLCLLQKHAPDINLKDCILLDNESTHDLFGNRRFVRNIRKAPYVLTIATNGRNLTVTQQANLTYGRTV